MTRRVQAVPKRFRWWEKRSPTNETTLKRVWFKAEFKRLEEEANRLSAELIKAQDKVGKRGI
ncbi:hypothetical protein LCGC14_2081390 [marine sediment metagenome]|uniref:Uncharacterized protein n=1 Tax=marine sediment metagenome TaxID=412755 RepID=A0A0F9EFS6_9ZZZZ